jgi:hypothetical protein
VQDVRAYRLLRRFADIRPDEAGPALCLFLHFFLIAFSIYIVKPVEDFLIGITLPGGLRRISLRCLIGLCRLQCVALNDCQAKLFFLL